VTLLVPIFETMRSAGPAEHLHRADPALHGAEPAGVHAGAGELLPEHSEGPGERRHDRRLHAAWRAVARRRAAGRAGRVHRRHPGLRQRLGRVPAGAVAERQRAMRTLPVGITLYQGEFTFPWPIISAALIVAIVPMAVLIALFQERVVGGLTQGGLKGLIMIRYGIIGCGSMGREHIENIKMIDGGVRSPRSPTPTPPAATPRQACCDGRRRSSTTTGPAGQRAVRRGGDRHAQLHAPRHDARRAGHRRCTSWSKSRWSRASRTASSCCSGQGPQGIVWVAQEYRYMPPVAEMIRMAHERRGRHASTRWRSASTASPSTPRWATGTASAANTGGTLVEKCCHYFNLMDLILQGATGARVRQRRPARQPPRRAYGGRTPDILDSAYVVVEYPSGARAMLDLCMFAENSVDNEHITVVGDEGKLESLLPSMTLRYGRREDWGKREVWGQPSGTGRACRCAGAGHQHQVPGPPLRRQSMSSTSVRRRRSATACRRDHARGRPARGGHRHGRAPQHRRRASWSMADVLPAGLVR
jgi:myo-inositol 2-dehydrogenase/D-chiro-inositol 1-dehydrogenase